MLSVAESAEILHVSPARVRSLIARGLLPARKVGRAWALREEDVMQRVAASPKAGRPPKNAATQPDHCFPDPETANTSDGNDLHALYQACKQAFSTRPDAHAIARAEAAEEASFYFAVADFFLQQRQRDLVKRGVF